MPVQVNVNFRSANDNIDAYFFLNAILLNKIEVTTAPAKTIYHYGEYVDYTGIAVTATYEDGSTKDITNLCTFHPRNGELFDGCSVEIGYCEGQDEKSCSFPLTALALSRIVIVSMPSKTSYKLGEAINYSGLSVKAVYSDNTEADITNLCTFSSPAGKPFDPYEDSHVSISYSEGESEFSEALTFTEITMALLVTSAPAKTAYKYGEAIDYTGLTVKAVFSDGSEKNVTDYCTFSPAQGKPFDPETDTSVVITYSEERGGFTDSQTSTFALTHIALSNISVTSNPVKNSYKYGEAIDYTGLVVTATYSDGSTENITSSCSISPAEGKAFDPATDTNITISYSELGSSETLDLFLNPISLISISVTSNPAKTSYREGEHISYTGLAVSASYSDGSSADVTASCSITPRAGKLFDPDNDYSIDITYSEGSVTETASIMLTEIYLTGIQVTSNPYKTAYKYREVINFAGMTVTATYSDGTSEDVTKSCSFSPYNGKNFDPDTDSSVEITFEDASCSLNLTHINLASLAVTANPDKTVYSSGESINYYGIVVTASYSDNSDEDVTRKCDFSPVQGKAFDPETDTTVTITYSEGDNSQTCYLILTVSSSMSLIVASMPTKTSYNQGEAVDLSGVVIQSEFPDGTRHTVTDYCDFSSSTLGTEIKVTVKCAPPAEPYVFDLNLGYVDNGTWKYENPTRTYIDIYRVTAGHKYLLALDGNVGSRFRVMFTTTDVSNASSNVSGTKIINTNNPTAYTTVEYTPSANGYIVAAKDNVGKSGIKTYLYDAASYNKTAKTEFTLTTIGLTSLSVTKPVKTRYRIGETFDFSGAIVTATYSDGSIVNVTDEASFSPAHGSTVTSSNPAAIVYSPVSVSYRGLSASFEVVKAGVAIMSLSVTPPDKTLYRVGEAIDYSGCTVTAVYWDGSTKDVTANAVFQPSSGTAVSRYSIDNDNNLAVSISYQEIDETVCSNFAQGEQVSTYSYAYDKNGDAMWYASTYLIHLSVTYLDTQTGITETKILTAGDFTYDPNITSASYLSYENYADLLANGRWFGYRDYETGQFIKTELDTYMQALTAKEFGGFALVDGQFGYYVSSFHDLFPDNVEEKIGSGEFTSSWFAENCAGRYPLGRTFVPLLTVYYEALASHSINLSVATLLRTLSITPPAKTTYHYREALDCSGCIVTASYSNGDTEDVTALAAFSPAAGTLLTSSRSVRVSYKNSGNETATGSFSINVIRLSRIAVTSPEKSSYRYGEAIDYTGATVTAVYSDGSMENVTSSAVFSPANGSIITQDMTGSVSVSVSYTNQWNETVSGSLSLGIITLQQELQITPPDKTTYHIGENISYRGAIVNAVFSDGSSEDVTASAVFSPANGTVITQDTPDSVSITYSNQWSENAEGCLTLTFISLQHELQITPPDKTSYHLGEAIDYSGAVVTAVYSDNTAVDVTSYAVFSPANGTVVTQDTPDSVSITYSNQWSENAEGSLSLSFNNE